MSGGNFNPSPLRFGASNDTNLEALLNELRQSVGTAFNVDYGSITWIYLNALARVMNDLFEQNERLANQWDPERMTDFLERWEKILGLMPMPGASLVERRRNVLLKFQAFGQSATQQVFFDLLTALLGNLLLTVINTSGDNAVAFVPGGGTVPGGATLGDGDWSSNVSYLPIIVVKPFFMDELTFYNTVNQIFNFLDGLLPAWTSYDWILQGANGPGFFLDDENNLDNEAFD